MKAIKRILALALVLGMVPWGTSPVLAQGDLAINETHFPDAKFRDYVSEVLDENHDGSLSPAEVEAVKEIVVFRKGITDLKGVQYFKNLEELNCLENKISSLDLRDNTKLKRLDCDKNKLTSLDVSKNPDLIYLSCINNSLTSLSVSANPQLAGFYCDENSLTSLDVSKNPDLLYFSCSNNNLASLSLRANTKLAGLYCDDNRLTSLDLSHNPALISLACHLNELETLDLSKNPDLEDLSCHNNKLKDLDLRNNPKLMELMCSENQLTSLDVSHNPELDHLDCYANQLTSLDVSQNPALRYLDCYGNQLTSLDLANNLNIAEEDFSGGGQEYELRVYNKTLSFDPAQLDGTFDLARTRDWAGASPVGTLVKLDSEEVDRITYTYEAGEDKDLKVSLYISYSQDPVSPSDDKPVSKAKAVVSLIIGSPRLETDQDGTKTTSTMEVAPYIKEGRTMLPVRYVAQALGFEVDWNEASRTVLLKGDGRQVQVSVDTKKITVDGVSYQSDVQPEIKDGRTFLPLRVIAEALDFEVVWDPATKTVTLKEEDYRAKIPVDTNKITVGGLVYESDVKPMIKNGRTLLPLRALAQALGFEVEWDEATRTVVLKAQGYRAEIPVDSKTFVVNGVTYESDVQPEIKDGRTMLPLRAISQALGFEVQWQETTRTVLLKDKK